MSGNINDMVLMAKAFEKDVLSGAIAKRCVTELKVFLEPKIKQCVNNAVEEWRGTYSPEYYTPSGGLQKMYKINLTEKEFSISFGPEFGTSRYRSVGDVYNIVFKEGYHGGYWRTPLFIWKYRSPRSTIKGPSILKLALDNIDIAWATEIKPKIKEIGKAIVYSYFK